MPAAYTHDSFGKNVLRRLPEREAAIIRSKYNLFAIGLQGPDVFFYYHPVWKNPISEMGHQIHRESGETFIRRMAKTAALRGFPDDDLSFIYGNICHYALDRQCHGNIFHWQEISGAEHAMIEGQMDRALMLRNGEDPLLTMPARHIHPDRKAAELLHLYYPELSEKRLLAVLRSFRSFNKFLTMPEVWKRRVVYALMKRIGVYDSLRGHFIDREADSACEPDMEELLALYDGAIDMAVMLVERFRDMAEDRETWSPLYGMNFESDYGKL